MKLMGMTAGRWIGALWVTGGAIWLSLSGRTVPLSGNNAPGTKLPRRAQNPVDGRELFQREWVPKDSRSHGGDGLGPLYNDTSCVACHSQGGPGGAGPSSKNVQVITAASTRGSPCFSGRRRVGPGSRALGDRRGFQVDFGGQKVEEKNSGQTARERLVRLHPGFRAASSVVLHRFGTSYEYALWRSANGLGLLIGPGTTPMNPDGDFTVLLSERNPTALFGSGKIDSIPEEIIRAGVNENHAGFPEIRGSVAWLKDGRIGRFGWKAQKASLHDFVLAACAIELGLNVPGEAQSDPPYDSSYKPPGYDLNQEECAALVSFVQSLPAPVVRSAPTFLEFEDTRAGKSLFTQVGCAACHRPKLGDVEGVYSDLLLHDMGPELSDNGGYGTSASTDELDEPLLPLAQAEASPSKRPQRTRDLIGAKRQEWRTPPLWGLRDSAPYLHDGRARTLDEAIHLHAGEASKSAERYAALPSRSRQSLLAFLRSLAVSEPPPATD